MGFICANRVSQNRRTCWGTSSSSAASLMVRNASGDFSKDYLRFAVKRYSIITAGLKTIYDIFHHLAWTKNHHAARRNGNLFTGFRIAPYATFLATYHEGAKGRKFYRCSFDQGRRNQSKTD